MVNLTIDHGVMLFYSCVQLQRRVQNLFAGGGGAN